MPFMTAVHLWYLMHLWCNHDEASLSIRMRTHHVVQANTLTGTGIE